MRRRVLDNPHVHIDEREKEAEIARSEPPKRHTSQIQREFQALCDLFNATNEHNTWKEDRGWGKLVEAMKSNRGGDDFAMRGSLATQLPLHGVQWERNHVVALDLSSNGLSGEIPPTISNFRFLRTLKLHNNPRLHGDLPRAMYSQLTHLQYCYLNGTSLSNVFPYEIAHSFQITKFLAASKVQVCFQTNVSKHGQQHAVRWTADLSEAFVKAIHTTLLARHPKVEVIEEQINVTAQNATGPERVAAATKLQRIYRARIERRKFRNFLNSLFERVVDPATGYEYFINKRTGESTWRRPTCAHTPRPSNQTIGKGSPLHSSDSPWQELEDEHGNKYYWNSITGESTWEPPALMSHIHQELRKRYPACTSDSDRIDLLFRDIDRDNTGSIDKDEFARLCGDLGMPMSEQQIAHAFRDLDATGDGELDRHEIISWLTRNFN